MDEKEAMVRAINMRIIKKVWDVCSNKDMNSLFEILDISETTIERICNADEKAGVRWKYDEVAKKIGIKKDVFSGKHLIEIGCESETEVYLKNNFFELLKNSNSADKKMIQKMIDMKKDLISQYNIWKTLITEKDRVEGSMDQAFYSELINKVGEQAKEVNFNDINLWKLWRFIMIDNNK